MDNETSDLVIDKTNGCYLLPCFRKLTKASQQLCIISFGCFLDSMSDILFLSSFAVFVSIPKSTPGASNGWSTYWTSQTLSQSAEQCVAYFEFYVAGNSSSPFISRFAYNVAPEESENGLLCSDTTLGKAMQGMNYMIAARPVALVLFALVITKEALKLAGLLTMFFSDYFHDPHRFQNLETGTFMWLAVLASPRVQAVCEKVSRGRGKKDSKPALMHLLVDTVLEDVPMLALNLYLIAVGSSLPCWFIHLFEASEGNWGGGDYSEMEALHGRDACGGEDKTIFVPENVDEDDVVVRCGSWGDRDGEIVGEPVPTTCDSEWAEQSTSPFCNCEESGLGGGGFSLVMIFSLLMTALGVALKFRKLLRNLKDRHEQLEQELDEKNASQSDEAVELVDTTRAKVPAEEVTEKEKEKEKDDLADFLTSLSLNKYIDDLKKQDIDLEVLKTMTTEEMTEAGLSIGARKKIQLASSSEVGQEEV